MAAGTVKWFDQGLLNLGKKLMDLSGDTLKLGIIDNAVTPVHTTADPCWGSGGSTNFSSHEVAHATAYTAPISLASVTWTVVSNVPTLRAANVTVARDAGGFTNGYYGIIYDDTTSNKNCVGFVDLGGPISLVTGSLTIDWSGANGDILTLTQS